MYMYIYIYMYMCIYIHIHICIYIPIYTYANILMGTETGAPEELQQRVLTGCRDRGRERYTDRNRGRDLGRKTHAVMYAGP